MPLYYTQHVTPFPFYEDPAIPQRKQSWRRVFVFLCEDENPFTPNLSSGCLVPANARTVPFSLLDVNLLGDVDFPLPA